MIPYRERIYRQFFKNNGQKLTRRNGTYTVTDGDEVLLPAGSSYSELQEFIRKKVKRVLYRWENSTSRLPTLMSAQWLGSEVMIPLLVKVWPDCDKTYHYRHAVLHLLRSARPAVDWKDHVEQASLEFFDSLPDVITVFRGADESRIDGISWTTDIDTARGFARGHRGIRYDNPVVAEMTVKKSDILFATQDRTESEVVISPSEWSIIERIPVQAAA